jgi:type VII secretion integral membrane protein EccD
MRLMLSVSDPGLHRVSVHAGDAVVDLALPSGMPIASLIPPIVDTLKSHGADSSAGLRAARYQLSGPGAATLNSSMTLAQSGIRDGDILILSRSATPSPVFRYDDVAEAVSETLNGRIWSQSQNHRATRLSAALAAGWLTGVGGLALIRNTFTANTVSSLGTAAGIAALVAFVAVMLAALAQRAYRDSTAGLTLSLIATAFAAIAGFLAVPGTPGVPNVLLAATAGGVTAVLAQRVSDCGAATLTAASCFAMVVAVAAFGGVVTGAPLYVIGAVAALVSLGLLGVAARVAIALAGLSPKPADPQDDGSAADGLAARAIRADEWLASLLAAFSSSAAVGAIITVLAGTPRLGCIAYGAATSALLLLRANSVDRKRTLVCVISGVVTIGTTFGCAAISTPEHGPWIAAATALLVAATVYLGFVAPAISLSPIARKSVELFECLVLIAMVPLTCWICGLYGAARGLHTT